MTLEILHRKELWLQSCILNMVLGASREEQVNGYSIGGIVAWHYWYSSGLCNKSVMFIFLQSMISHIWIDLSFPKHFHICWSVVLGKLAEHGSNSSFICAHWSHASSWAAMSSDLQPRQQRPLWVQSEHLPRVTVQSVTLGSPYQSFHQSQPDYFPLHFPERMLWFSRCLVAGDKSGFYDVMWKATSRTSSCNKP